MIKNIIKQIERFQINVNSQNSASFACRVSCHKSINLVRYFKCIIPNVRKVAILKEIVVFYFCKLQITSSVAEIVVQMLLCVFLCPLVKLMITWNAYIMQKFSYTHKMYDIIEYNSRRAGLHLATRELCISLRCWQGLVQGVTKPGARRDKVW